MIRGLDRLPSPTGPDALHLPHCYTKMSIWRSIDNIVDAVGGFLVSRGEFSTPGSILFPDPLSVFCNAQNVSVN